MASSQALTSQPSSGEIQRFSVFRLIAYAGPSIPIAAIGLPLAVYLPPFYAGPMGLGLAAVGTLFMVARLWDVVVDPVLGVLSDRFPSRWGRRRHWVVISVPIMMTASYYIFVPSGRVGATYLLTGLFGLYLGFTMLLLAHMSWGAELSDDYDERSRIQAYREGLTIVGVPLVLLLPAVIERLGGKGVETARVAAMGWFIIIALPLTVALAVSTTPERKAHAQDEVSFFEAIGPLFSNRPLMMVAIADLASGFSLSSLGAMFIYIATHAWRVGQYASLLLLLYYCAGVGFIPVVLRLSYRFGKHPTLIGAALFNVVFTPFVLVIPPGNVVVAALMLLFFGINVGSSNILYRSIMADVVDYDELETGQRRTGLFYALLTFTAKVGSAVAIAVVYWMLAVIGFKPEGPNTDAAIRGLLFVFVGVPITCNLFVAAVMWRFPIGRREQEDMRRRLDERRLEKMAAAERLSAVSS